jgi:hypothetical protein
VTSVFIRKRLSSVTYLKFRRLIYVKPITSDACSVLYQWNTGIVGFKSSPGIEVCVVSSVLFAAGGGRNRVQGVLPNVLQDFENRNPGHAFPHKIRLQLLLYNIPSLFECSASLLSLVEEHFNPLNAELNPMWHLLAL